MLARNEVALPGAYEALSTLRDLGVNFALVSNGGGMVEAERAQALSEALGIHIDETQLIQSHTPFRTMDELKNKTVLVSGGKWNDVRNIALQ